MPEPESCRDCNGRGWVANEAGAMRRCDCQQRGLVARLFAGAGIPARYQGCKLTNFQTASADPRERAQLLAARTAAERYVEEFLVEGGRFTQSGLIYYGPPGGGKTHLVVAIVLALIERYRIKARFCEFTSLVDQIQATFDPESPETKRTILDPLINADLLALDELGAQQPTPWVRDLLYLLINARYTRRLPTLFTTNYRLERPGSPPPANVVKLDRGRDPEPSWGPPDQPALLSTRLPPMLVSRLYEMAKPIVLDVEDFRQQKAFGAHLR
jgi:DNA replication protein DnaC